MVKNRYVTFGAGDWCWVLCCLPYEWFAILNDMDEIVGGMISKFTDNTMIGSVVDSEEGVQGYNI